jgi:hypothetical protein
MRNMFTKLKRKPGGLWKNQNKATKESSSKKLIQTSDEHCFGQLLRKGDWESFSDTLLQKTG